jgi:hypothetical protein
MGERITHTVACGARTKFATTLGPPTRLGTHLPRKHRPLP